jgi:hypothetical protein
MKITKRKLKQIIREEKHRLLSETMHSGFDQKDPETQAMLEDELAQDIAEEAVEGYQRGQMRNGAQIVSFVRQECNKLSLDHKFDQIISQVINSMLTF